MGFIFTLTVMVVVWVLSELLSQPEFDDAKPSGIGDFKFPTASQSRTIPLMWGTALIDGPNVIWYGDFVQARVREYMKTGVFTGKRVTTGFKYYIGMQLGLCREEIDSLRKIYVKDDLLYDGSTTTYIDIDEPGFFGGDKGGTGGLVGRLRIHTGSSTQTASTYLSQFQVVGGTTPTYKGTAYAVYEHGWIGNSTTIDAWAFEVRRIPNGLALGTPSVNSGEDANPMNVIYELMTNTEWGMSVPAADIDTSNFSTAAATLLSEGNGYSRILDTFMEAKELLRELEEQTDGLVYLDHSTGKWKITLVRNDYDIDTVPQLNASNIIELVDFARGAWRDTFNQVRAKFNNRSNRYKEDYGFAQDLANAQMQGGGSVSTGRPVPTVKSYPGCKDATLANSLAWRDIRPLSYPLAKAKFIVDRSFWDTSPGDVMAWTDTDLDLTKLPMRVLKVDHGQLEDNRMVLDCVQDVFQSGVGLFSDPPNTNWEDIAIPTAFPSAQQLCFEAPRRFVYLDPGRTGDMQDRLWATGRDQGGAAGFTIRERHATAPSSPAGDYTDVGTSYGFILMGELKSDLDSGSGVPTTSFLIEATPDTQTTLEEAFTDDPDITDQGVNMHNLIMIDDEFMQPRSASTSGSDVQLNDVYRGVLDGGQANHSSGADVYLVFYGGNISETTIPDGENVDVKLTPFNAKGELDESSATVIQFETDDRLIRPYPPASMDLNGTLFNSGTVSLDYLASGAAETTGMDLDFIRRDYRTAEGDDEIAALSTDAATLFPTFPSANSTVHDAEVWNDPDGSPALLFTESAIAGTTQDILRLKILQATDGAIPSRMRIILKAKHDAGGKSNLYSRNNLSFDFDTASSALSGQVNYGALDTNDVSNTYTADAAGTHGFTLSSAFTAGDVEYSLNGGGWTQLIAGGGTTGNIAGVSVTDTIRIRHLSSDSSALKQIDMAAPGAGTDAYGILFT